MIGETVQRLLLQDYPHYELLLLDDASSDGTLEVAMQAAGEDPRLHLFQGQPPARRLDRQELGLPPARPRRHAARRSSSPTPTCAGSPERYNAWQAGWGAHMPIHSRFTTQETVTWPERLVVPMMTSPSWLTCPSWACATRPGSPWQQLTGNALLSGGRLTPAAAVTPP